MNCLIHDGELRSLPPVFKGVPAHLVNQGCDTKEGTERRGWEGRDGREGDGKGVLWSPKNP